MIPGFVCGSCGALGTGSDECPDWATAAEPVPDLLEEITEAEAQAVADAVRAYIDDGYYPAIDLEALRAAYQRLISTIGNPSQRLAVRIPPTVPGRRSDQRPS